MQTFHGGQSLQRHSTCSTPTRSSSEATHTTTANGSSTRQRMDGDRWHPVQQQHGQFCVAEARWDAANITNLAANQGNLVHLSFDYSLNDPAEAPTSTSASSARQ